jgi:hypothetical protein
MSSEIVKIKKLHTGVIELKTDKDMMQIKIEEVIDMKLDIQKKSLEDAPDKNAGVARDEEHKKRLADQKKEQDIQQRMPSVIVHGVPE